MLFNEWDHKRHSNKFGSMAKRKEILVDNIGIRQVGKKLCEKNQKRCIQYILFALHINLSLVKNNVMPFTHFQ